ncbi:aspartate/glutamate racemase family protein [Brucella gallinifaecis]|uniref:maleate cis-trans isomerase family protein n=1 Tax=Brucella gallinifaecis TaxID=215590 RepID=UPI002361BF29|nr:aspartate/glutamate racemase family protein [Brucella gallinifaecis]
MSSRTPRLGLMVPSSNTVMEADLNRELSALCSVHTARMYMVETTRDAELAMVEKYAPEAARDLGTLRPDLVVFGCTSAGSLFGAAYDTEVCTKLGKIANAPTLGVLTAVGQELDATPGRRLAVITPYVDDLTNSVARAAESSTRHVVAAVGMGISDNVMLSEPTPAEIVEFSRKSLAGVDFDLLLVSCTNFRALEAKAMLEQEFAVPVVTSNSAVVASIRRSLS